MIRVFARHNGRALAPMSFLASLGAAAVVGCSILNRFDPMNHKPGASTQGNSPTGGNGIRTPPPSDAGPPPSDVFCWFRNMQTGGPYPINAPALQRKDKCNGTVVEPGQQPSQRGGSVMVNEDGSFLYAPPASTFWGDDYFTVLLLPNVPGASGATSAPVTATVRITIDIASIDLADLESEKGNGVVLRDMGGGRQGAASAGDVNGDGFSDVIVSGPTGAYVVFGSAEPKAITRQALDAATTKSGFKIGGSAGLRVAAAGDVNADGFDDVIVGDPSASVAGEGSGVAYVVFGSAEPGPVQLSELAAGDGTRGFALVAAHAGDEVGSAVSAAGDINGDGFSDVIVGAPGYSYKNEPGTTSTLQNDGAAYVVFGMRQDPGSAVASVSLADLGTSKRGWMRYGVIANDRVGTAVGLAGDPDGDGQDNAAIGSPTTSLCGTSAGCVWAVPSNNGKVVDSVPRCQPVALQEYGSFLFEGRGQDLLGYSIASAGDFNGDGFPDLIMGARNVNGGYDGVGYVAFGQSSAHCTQLGVDPAADAGANGDFVRLLGPERLSVDLSAAEAAQPSVAGVGDFNGDGFDDVVVGIPQSQVSTLGSARIIFGKSDRGDVDLSMLHYPEGIALRGSEQQSAVGLAVSSAGDFNGDGLDDVLVTAQNANGSASTYVVFGWVTSDNVLGNQAHAILGDHGDNVVAYPYSGVAPIRVSLGNGTDTVRVDGTSVTLDLRKAPRRAQGAAPRPSFRSVEHISLSGSGNRVIVDDATLRSLPQSRPGLVAPLAKTLEIEAPMGGGLCLADLKAGDFQKLDTTNAGRTVYQRLDKYYGFEVGASVDISYSGCAGAPP